jgi:hypothetical protein
MRDIPKKFYKMTLDEQETFLTQLLQKMNQDYDRVFRMLATVRGGFKHEPLEERPDLEYDIQQLKSTL